MSRYLDVRLRIEFFDHPKTRALERALGSDGIVALLRLWTWARVHRPDGVLREMSGADIESAARWRGPGGHLLAALIVVPPGEAGGFVESDGRGVFALRNWSDAQPWATQLASAADLAKARAEGGRKGGMKSALLRAAKGFGKRGADGRFHKRTPPKPTEGPTEAPTEGLPKGSTVGTSGATPGATTATPKPTASSSSYSLEEGGEPPRRSSSTESDPEVHAVTLRLLEALDLAEDSPSAAPAKTAVLELVKAGATPDALRRDLASNRPNSKSSPWAWKRGVEERLAIGGRFRAQNVGPAAPDSNGSVQFDAARQAIESAAPTFAAVRGGLPVTERSWDAALAATAIVDKHRRYLAKIAPDLALRLPTLEAPPRPTTFAPPKSALEALRASRGAPAPAPAAPTPNP